MGPYLISSSLSLGSVLKEAIYTGARLAADSDAVDLQPELAACVQRIRDGMAKEVDLAIAEVTAQAACDRTVEKNAAQIFGFYYDLLKAVGSDRTSARYRMFFGTPPSHLAGLGLASQLDLLYDWSSRLAADADFGSWAATFTTLLDEGRAISATRSAAENLRVTWRSMDREALVNEVNQLRQTIFGALSQRVRERGKTRNWPNGFFRRASARKSGATDGGSAPETSPVAA
jgi:hypothetical protein